MTKKISTSDLDPFQFALLYQKLEKVHTGWLALVSVGVAGVLILASVLEGTFGGLGDFQVVADVKRTLGIAHPERSSPSFPFMRDFVSWLLATIVVTGAVLLHRHWQYMSTCLSKLAKNGVLVARKEPRSNRLSKMLRVDRMIQGVGQDQALNTIVIKVMEVLKRRSVGLLVLMGGSALVLTILLILGLENNMFHVLAPAGASPQEKSVWVREAYSSWWAGKHHLAGHILYWVLAWFAIFVILSFQVVGVIATYLLAAMHFVVEPSADWLNRDGRYGWTPLAALYRTVMWANGLLGLTLTIVLASLGINNYGWVAVLVVVYIVLVPLFVGVPWLVVRRAADTARNARAEQIAGLMADRGIDIESDVENAAPYIAELERCRAARIRPLRLGTASFSTYAVIAVLPVLLTAAQIFLPLTFGTR
ncbi:hypothetical protein [Lentzea albidocapillata]|uniref:Uncharacterized protein n=1 Tax=Lentzea albidocapillata TaxID=40571 RepID=A0A1W2FRN7_9PSEU|nr:hypothetical protein [Lentzea albidocapillata]SMD24580.1 hypothetical protein SAMN05660733_07747 [Lentzea albidocapillata]